MRAALSRQALSRQAFGRQALSRQALSRQALSRQAPQDESAGVWRSAHPPRAPLPPYLTARLPLPPSPCSRIRLRALLIRHAGITTLPDSIGALSGSLRVLKLASCGELTHLPEAIGELLHLQVLALSRCLSLKALPDSLGRLGSLRQLELVGCEAITALPPSCRGALTALRSFDFSGCEDLADAIFDDPIIDELEARGCGVFGPDMEIEPPGYDAIKEANERDEAERNDASQRRLNDLRAAGEEDAEAAA